MKEILGIAHVAIKVSDIARTLAFYERVFGFREMMRLNNADGSLFLLYLRITDTQYLEVFPNAATDRASDNDANGLNHFCLHVSDPDAVKAKIDELGIPLLWPYGRAIDGNRQFWIEDPDGNRIEIMEMDPNCLPYQGVKRLREEGKGVTATFPPKPMA
jgi:lactoylglutathione lyase